MNVTHGPSGLSEFSTGLVDTEELELGARARADGVAGRGRGRGGRSSASVGGGRGGGGSCAARQALRVVYIWDTYSINILSDALNELCGHTRVGDDANRPSIADGRSGVGLTL